MDIWFFAAPYAATSSIASFDHPRARTWTIACRAYKFCTSTFKTSICVASGASLFEHWNYFIACSAGHLFRALFGIVFFLMRIVPHALTASSTTVRTSRLNGNFWSSGFVDRRYRRIFCSATVSRCGWCDSITLPIACAFISVAYTAGYKPDSESFPRRLLSPTLWSTVAQLYFALRFHIYWPVLKRIWVYLDQPVASRVSFSSEKRFGVHAANTNGQLLLLTGFKFRKHTAALEANAFSATATFLRQAKTASAIQASKTAEACSPMRRSFALGESSITAISLTAASCAFFVTPQANDGSSSSPASTLPTLLVATALFDTSGKR